MKIDWSVRFFLGVIAIALTAIALHSYITPDKVAAETSVSTPFYVEPGVYLLREPDGGRQVLGKVVVDMRNGNVWGYPTLSADPYPTPDINTKSVTSHGIYLGKFALTDMDRPGK